MTMTLKTPGRPSLRRLFAPRRRVAPAPSLRLRLPGLLPGALLLALLATQPAAAAPLAPDDGCLNDVACRTSYDQAVKLFEGGRFEAALASFQAAYGRRQMPWLLINIGRTLHRLGRPAEALAYYDRYRQAEARPDPETATRLKKYTAQAQALVDTANQHSATPPPPDDDGANDLAVAPPPADPATKATPAAAVTGTPTAAVAADPASSSATSASDRPAEGQPVYKKWWFWTAIGGGVAAVVVVGVVAGVASQGSSALPSGVPTIMFRL